MSRIYQRVRDYSKRMFFKDPANVSLVCNMYSDGYSSVQIAKALDLSKSAVLKVLKTCNIKKRDSSTSHTKYYLNENIFNTIDTHEKAYWIGFLVADGTITNKCMKLALSIKDISHLEKFKSFLNATHPIHIYEYDTTLPNGRKRKYKYAILSIRNDKIIKTLNRYSIKERKTFTVEFAKNIPAQFINSYVAGVIDANGFITVSNGYLHFGVTCNSKFATDLQNFLVKNYNLNKNKLINHYASDEIKIVKYSGAPAVRALKLIYSETNSFMNRKKEKLDFFL